MVNINRQINTAEVFEFKLSELDAKLNAKTEEIVTEVEILKDENERLKSSIIMTGTGLLIRFWIRLFITVLLTIGFIAVTVFNGVIDDLIFTIIWLLVSAYIAYRPYGKYRKKIRYKEEVQQKIEENNQTIERLNMELTRATDKFNAMKTEEYAKLDQLMLNNKELSQYEAQQYQQSIEQMKECPYCAELIKEKANYCRHCQNELV